jgi:hypothetical protein
MTDGQVRRLVTGIGVGASVHCLSPSALRPRIGDRQTDEREFMRKSVAAAVAQHLIATSVPTMATTRAVLGRHAWLSWGAGQWLSGQTEHAAGFIRRRLRRVERSSYPPRRADAILLGGTVLEFVAHEQGRAAALALLRKGIDRSQTGLADGDSAHAAGPWRTYLARRAEQA